MARTFSLPSDALGYYLGYALLHADDVAIVSPWVSDVQVSFPVNNAGIDRQLYLSEALAAVADETRLRVYLRSGEQHNNRIRSRLPDAVTVEIIDDLHAKAIVAPETVYMGSANVTRGGLFINRELCHIIENEYGSTDAYIEAELDLSS